MLLQQLLRKKPIDKIYADSSSDAVELTGHSEHGLKKTLTVVDLTSLGIAAVIGAGIFATVGTAAANGGPAVSLLFIFTAIACGFSALCYAQFVHYSCRGFGVHHAYASLGEFVAWMIGWDLIMEYAIGNIAVAISWSDYFTAFLRQYGVHFPSIWVWIFYPRAVGSVRSRNISPAVARLLRLQAAACLRTCSRLITLISRPQRYLVSQW